MRPCHSPFCELAKPNLPEVRRKPIQCGVRLGCASRPLGRLTRENPQPGQNAGTHQPKRTFADFDRPEIPRRTQMAGFGKRRLAFKNPQGAEFRRLAKIRANRLSCGFARRVVLAGRWVVWSQNGISSLRSTRVPMPVPVRPNIGWSLDFVSDTFGASRKFRILAVNDDCTRENLGLIADTSLSGERVARELTAMIRIYRKPGCIVSDRRRSENDPGDRFPEEGHRVHPHRDPQMGRRYRRGLALHRPRQAPAERVDRKLQRQPARGMPD